MNMLFGVALAVTRGWTVAETVSMHGQMLWST